MKKTLVALAALASVSAFAQSTVSITGLIDTGYLITNAPTATAETKGIAANNTATTVLTLAGTEDLGGGLKANFQLQLTPDFTSGNGVGGSGTTNTGSGQQAFVGLEGNFGDVKLGRVNTNALDAWGVGSVFGTAIGSGYSSSGNIFTRYSASAATTTTSNQAAPTRFNRAIRYTTPAFSGLTGSLLIVPKVSGNSTDTTNQQGVTDIGLRYTNGPLNVAYATQKIEHTGTIADANQVLGAGTAVLADGKSNKLSILSANYTIGAATVYGATWTEKQDTSTAMDQTGRMIGAKYVVGAATYMASMGTSNEKSTANVDKKIAGIGVDYALSKRTNLYARYDTRDANKNDGADTSAAGVTKRTAFGVKHTF